MTAPVATVVTGKGYPDLILMQTHNLGFELGGKNYAMEVQTCTSRNLEGLIVIDITDILEVWCDGERNFKVIDSIEQLFGTKWYEDVVFEEAKRDYMKAERGVAM